MAGDTFEERLTRLEEQLKALQALTQGLAAWEMGATGAPDQEKPKETKQLAGGTGRPPTRELPGSSARI
jgi:hypothetical protein